MQNNLIEGCDWVGVRWVYKNMFRMGRACVDNELTNFFPHLWIVVVIQDLEA